MLTKILDCCRVSRGTVDNEDNFKDQTFFSHSILIIYLQVLMSGNQKEVDLLPNLDTSIKIHR